MKILIAIPCMDTVSTPFMQSLLALHNVGEVEYMCGIGSLVYDSRNKLADYAVKNGFDYILFLDSDMVFEPDMLERMTESIGERDFLTALCFSRRPPNYRPCIYRRLGYQVDQKQQQLSLYSDILYEYPEDEAFEIEGSGMACVLMRVSMVEKVTKTKGLPFSPLIGFGEDLSFCIKARACGYKLYCDPGIKIGHIGNVIIDEEVFKRSYYGADRSGEEAAADKA